METDYKSMLDRIMTFVSDRLGVDKSKITEQTSIEDDFGIAGLDTLTFYEEFFTEFKISNPTDFNVGQYVTSENMQVGVFIKSLFSTTTRKTFKTTSVSLKHLTNVALRRKWYEQ
jgi:hypothetical protein